MEILGIQFAPLNVPLKRRLQTLAAAAWFVTMVFGGFAGLFLSFYLLFFSTTRWFVILYYIWIYIDRETAEKGGRRSEWVRSWSWWKYMTEYFPIKLAVVPSVELDPKKNYLFCCFPHGMLSTGPFSVFATNHLGFSKHFPHHKSHALTLAQHFQMPFFRELALSLGGCSASAASISHILGTPGGGNAACLVVGGAAESYYCRPGEYKTLLNKRKGFVKLALRNGAPLVPLISFGETDLYSQVSSPEGSILRRIQEFIRKHVGMAPAIPIGRGFFQYSFGLAPRRKPITCVGKLGRDKKFYQGIYYMG